MAMKIEYRGAADTRVIPQAQVIAGGFADPGANGLVWNKLNNFELELSDLLATWVLALDQDFHTEDEMLPGDILAANMAGGKVLARASTQTAVTVANATTHDPVGLAIAFDVTALKPVDVFFYVPWIQSGASGMTGALVISDLANVAKGYIPIALGATTYGGGLTVHEFIDTPGHYERKARVQVLTGSSGLNFLANLAYVRAHIRAVEA